jgi:hypothetical protein
MKRAQAHALVLLTVACAGAPACGLNQGGVTPPADTIAFPASAVMDRSGEWLLVTNSNADLRYNDGSLMALSLTRAAQDRDPNDPAHPVWGDCSQVNDPNPRSDTRAERCCWDVVNHRRDVLNCDERAYVGSDTDAAYLELDDEALGKANVRIGSFAAGMVLQQPKCPTLAYGGVECSDCAGFSTVDDRLYIGVRGDTSVTFVDVESRGPTEPPLLKCVGNPEAPEAPGDFASCDDAHRVIRAQSGLASLSADPDPERPPIPLPDEPYALAVDDSSGLLFVGHLTGNTSRPFTGGYSLFDISPLGPDHPHLATPRFIAPFTTPFAANNVGAVGISSLKARRNSYGTTTVYASSRYVPQVAGLGTTATCPDRLPIREIAAFPNGTFYSSPLVGGEVRGIEFLDDQRAFVLQRSPPALISYLGTTPTDVLETCGSPTFLDMFTFDPAVGPRLFVTCSTDGEIYVFDPTVPRLVRSFLVGRGPAGLVPDVARQVAYVVGFGDNNISVIDLRPGSPTEYRVTQRIGFPRTIPR